MYGDALGPSRQALLGSKNLELDEANVDAVRVYMLTRNQVVTVGNGQPIALNLSAVKDAMDALGIVDQADCLTKVVRLWNDRDGMNLGDAR